MKKTYNKPCTEVIVLQGTNNLMLVVGSKLSEIDAKTQDQIGVTVDEGGEEYEGEAAARPTTPFSTEGMWDTQW